MKENINNALATARAPTRTHSERRVKFSDTYIKQKRKPPKLFSEGDSEVPVLRIYVHPSGSVKFYYAYRPANKKNFTRIKIGNFNIINVKQAKDKAKKC
jgi:hypothetical protein|tara:strand:+ start:164 stop:460 length:297 start_codon:yes stop_codon:yes gene_type:complete